jgi:phage repressor protein C with HTH and peptisase S24 domain
MVSTLEDRIKVVARDLPRGWQKKLSVHCGVSAPSVSDWVSGKTAVLESSHLLKCADFFKVSPTWLATGEGERVMTKASSPEALDTRRVFFADDIADLLKQIDNGDQLRRAYAAAVLAIVHIRDEVR